MKSSRQQRGVARRLIPSPSMIVALLALAVTLGGTAYAAATINGRNLRGHRRVEQIKDRSLLGRDIDRASPAPISPTCHQRRQVANGAWAAADLAADAVFHDKIKMNNRRRRSSPRRVVPPPAIRTPTDSNRFAIPRSRSRRSRNNSRLHRADQYDKLIITYSAQCEPLQADSQYLATQIHVDEPKPTRCRVDYKFCTIDPIDDYAQMSVPR